MCELLRDPLQRVLGVLLLLCAHAALCRGAPPACRLPRWGPDGAPPSDCRVRLSACMRCPGLGARIRGPGVAPRWSHGPAPPQESVLGRLERPSGLICSRAPPPRFIECTCLFHGPLHGSITSLHQSVPCREPSAAGRLDKLVLGPTEVRRSCLLASVTLSRANVCTF